MHSPQGWLRIDNRVVIKLSVDANAKGPVRRMDTF